MPLHLAGIQIDRDHRARVKIVTLSVSGVEVGPRIAGCPVKKIQLRVVCAAQPRAGAPPLPKLAPRFGSGLSLRRYRVQAPEFFSRLHRERADVSAHAAVTAGDTDND